MFHPDRIPEPPPEDTPTAAEALAASLIGVMLAVAAWLLAFARGY